MFRKFYIRRLTRGLRFRLMASYASDGQTSYGKEVDMGQGLVGQCAWDKKKILLQSNIPDAVRIASGGTVAGDVTTLEDLSVLEKLRQDEE